MKKPQFIDPQARQEAADQPKPPSHTEGVIPLGEALLRSTQSQQAREAARTAANAQQGKDSTGARANAQVAYTETEQEPKFRKVDGIGADKTGNKVWIPPRHKGLIDNLPRHPHAEEGQGVFSGPPIPKRG